MSTFQNDSNKSQQVYEASVEKLCLSLTSRQVSWVVSGFFLLSFCVFMAGYFLGQRKAIADFSCKIEQDSLGDAIFASFYSLYGGKDGSIELASDESSSPEGQSEPTQEVAQREPVEQSLGEIISGEQPVVAPESMDRYYAELIGFGNENAASAFVQRLQKETIPVQVKKRVSKTARGKQVVWYQVITDEFSDRASLLDLVKKIEQKEHLKGVNIQKGS